MVQLRGIPVLDEGIYRSLPLKMRQILTPEYYVNDLEYYYHLGCEAFLQSLAREYAIYDNDEFGELLIGILFREWLGSNYLSAAEGVIADRMMVGGAGSGSGLLIFWTTWWDSDENGQEFFYQYSRVLEKKHALSLPGISLGATREYAESSGQVRVYLERHGNQVFAMENFPAHQKEYFRDQLRNIMPDDPVKRAKAISQSRVCYPRVGKNPLKNLYFSPLR
jgi:hypothetical protein